jgi:hypothetical protein
MGRVPTWMGGSTINSTAEDEWVEMMATFMYYARNTRGLQFKILDPLNETDWDGIEGPQVNATQYVRLLRKLSQRLDAMGLSDVRFLGPNTASVSTGVNTYIPAMRNDAVVNARVDHFGLHDYGGGTGGAATALQGSGKNFWMTENADPAQMMNMIGQNANAVLLWEGFDSVYNHAILAGRGTTPPNDDPGINLPPLSYSTANKTYAARPLFFQYESVFKFILPGAVRINATDSASNVTLYAFNQPSTGRVTIIGQNTGSATLMTTTLTGLPGINTFEFYQATNSSLQRNADVPVSGASFSFTAPANTFFTLTGTPGGTSSGKTFYIRDGGTSAVCTDWTNACDTLPAALQRGATYYIAAGNYGSHTFDDAVSGTQVITLRKATTADHGTSTGWSDSFGSGAALFTHWDFYTDYYSVDGATRNADWNLGTLSQYGIRVAGSGPVRLDNGSGTGGNFLTFRNVDFQGGGRDTGNGDDVIYGLTGNSNITFQSCALHDSDRTIFLMRGNWQNLTVDHCYIARNTSTPATHGEMLSMTDSNNVIWSHNVMEDIEGTAFIAGLNGGTAANWKIFGNIALHTPAYIADTGRQAGHNAGVAGFVFVANDASNNNTGSNFQVFNNTFYDIQGLYSGVVIQAGTGHSVQNNVWYDSVRTNNSFTGTIGNNWYFNTQADGDTTASKVVCTSNCALFLNTAGRNFHLATATPAGLSLAVPFNIDPDGLTRGADGIWDRGAYEFVAGAASSACDLNGDSATNVSDVQMCVNQAIGTALCSTGDINKDGSCNVVDVQRDVNAALGGICVTQ